MILKTNASARQLPSRHLLIPCILLLPRLNPSPQEYILHCHELRGQLEQALSAKGVAGAPPSPALPFFDLLAHPAA